VKLSQPGGPGRFEMPNWDPVSQKKVRDALIVRAATVPDTRRMFGARDQLDAVRHLIGTATDWGGNPEKDALYVTILPSKNNGITIYRLDEGCAHRWRLVNQRLQRRRLFPEKLDLFERYWSASLTRHVGCAPDCQRFSYLPVQGIVRLKCNQPRTHMMADDRAITS
jgi:hypothetical protein